MGSASHALPQFRPDMRLCASAGGEKRLPLPADEDLIDRDDLGQRLKLTGVPIGRVGSGVPPDRPDKSQTPPRSTIEAPTRNKKASKQERLRSIPGDERRCPPARDIPRCGRTPDTSQLRDGDSIRADRVADNERVTRNRHPNRARAVHADKRRDDRRQPDQARRQPRRLANNGRNKANYGRGNCCPQEHVLIPRQRRHHQHPCSARTRRLHAPNPSYTVCANLEASHRNRPDLPLSGDGSGCHGREGPNDRRCC